MDYKEKVIALLNSQELSKEQKEKLESIFPELAESEDERIRKAVIYVVNHADYSIIEKTDFLATQMTNWLEKQGEKKPIKEHNVCDFCDEKHGCVNPCPTKLIEEQKPVDKIDQHSLPVSDDSSLPTFDENIYHPCTEEVYEQKLATWSEEDDNTLLDTINILRSCGRCSTDRKLWLLSLKDRVQPQPKQEWSEEDELHIRELESLVKRVWAIAEHENDKETIHKMSDLSFFLKTLKPQPKQEWSEEDNAMLISIENILIGRGHSFHDKEINWIKSLRHRKLCSYNPYKAVVESIAEMCKHYDKATDLQDFYDNVKVKCKDAKEYDSLFPSQWKPSEEQMKALEEAVHGKVPESNALWYLYRDLRKLIC